MLSGRGDLEEIKRSTREVGGESGLGSDIMSTLTQDKSSLKHHSKNGYIFSNEKHEQPSVLERA